MFLHTITIDAVRSRPADRLTVSGAAVHRDPPCSHRWTWSELQGPKTLLKSRGMDPVLDSYRILNIFGISLIDVDCLAL